MPFGLVQLSPDTRLEGWDGCSGYHYSDTVVYGFSHTHLSGTGVSDYGDVLFMPASSDVGLDNGYPDDPDAGYASRFDKASEKASPGYYAVHLKDENIAVELTATERTGLHRYVYPSGAERHLVLDLEHRDVVLSAGYRKVSDTEIEGWRQSTGWARDQHVYFVARFSAPMTGMSGDERRAMMTFGGEGELLVRVGISAVDIDGARKNLDAEQGEKGFDQIHGEAREAWKHALGKVELAGGTSGERETFYTALYHTMIAPNVWSDVDGRYRGLDQQIHTAENRRHYTVFSLWDTFRAAHPLYTILETARTREFIDTMLAMYEQGGRLPVWELAANETDTMIGYHSIPVIADAYLKGLDGFDTTLALEAMLDSATRDHFGLEAYKRQGFIGIEDEAESVSKTLEYTYDDWCIARMAQQLGEEEIAAEYDRRSAGWRHLFDPETGFMRARRNQRWLAPFDAKRVDNHYTEANAWQYRFFVPHDNDGLMQALGGKEAFVGQLDAMFEEDSATTGRDQADITGLIGQYAHGNEPSHHVAWLYHYADRPDKSAERVHQVLREMYTPEPDGLSGNEDCGQMSAWYVFSAMGFYPATPCTVDYPIGPPLFKAVTLNLENGNTFMVRKQGRGLYLESAVLNGSDLGRSFITHDEIMAGGELVLTVSKDPSKTFKVAPPQTGIEGDAIPAAPFVVSESDRFRTTLTAELQSADPEATIHYSTDGTLFNEYTTPLELSDSTTIRFYSDHAGVQSPTVESYLHRIPNDWTVSLEHDPLSQYSAGGPDALVDGLPGDANWRTGGWLGFQDADFIATVDLKKPTDIRQLGASFLQDQRSWIWMPTQVSFSVSRDGETFTVVGKAATDVADNAQGVHLREIVVPANRTRVRYVRVHATNYGTIPGWHLGRGGEGFIFVDEIMVRKR